MWQKLMGLQERRLQTSSHLSEAERSEGENQKGHMDLLDATISQLDRHLRTTSYGDSRAVFSCLCGTFNKTDHILVKKHIFTNLKQ